MSGPKPTRRYIVQAGSMLLAAVALPGCGPEFDCDSGTVPGDSGACVSGSGNGSGSGSGWGSAKGSGSTARKKPTRPTRSVAAVAPPPAKPAAATD